MDPITIVGRFGNLSRGKTCAKHMDSGAWGERDGGSVTLDQPGKWMLHTSDGFSRKETVYVTLDDAGAIVKGELGSRFSVA